MQEYEIIVNVNLEYKVRAKNPRDAVAGAENVELPNEYEVDTFEIVKVLDENGIDIVERRDYGRNIKTYLVIVNCNLVYKVSAESEEDARDQFEQVELPDEYVSESLEICDVMQADEGHRDPETGETEKEKDVREWEERRAKGKEQFKTIGGRKMNAKLEKEGFVHSSVHETEMRDRLAAILVKSMVKKAGKDQEKFEKKKKKEDEKKNKKMEKAEEKNAFKDKMTVKEAETVGFFKAARACGWGLYEISQLDGGVGGIWFLEKDAKGDAFLCKQVDLAGDVIRRIKSANKQR
jgi:hypothetical protein